ncbi:MAG: nucleotide exchange factor GrpE [Roseburia sp.]|nr:nucleotide exchange factor GrpE [Roseburia sp.]
MAKNQKENKAEEKAEEVSAEKPAQKAEKEAEQPVDLQGELEKARALAEEYKRKWYAVAAEYDNYRKRTQTQTSQAYQDGKAEAVLKLLPVSDTFGYAYDGATDEKTKTGIDKIIKNFNNILCTLGVEEIPLKEGDAFDESVAEAVMNVPAGEGEQPNTVKIILKKGYKSGGKVIRYAQVSVTV